MEKIFTFSPSDFAFLAHCPHCLYNKYVNKLVDRKPFPPVFGLLDIEQKKYFEKLSTKDISPELPKGKINKDIEGKFLESKKLKDNKERFFKIRGKADLILNLSETNSYAVIDFKTTKIDSKKGINYFYQLEAYALALEYPEDKEKLLTPVSHLGLLMFEPSNISKHSKSFICQNFKMSWLKVSRNKKKFLNFVTKLLDVLHLKKIPPPPEYCGCNTYKNALEKSK